MSHILLYGGTFDPIHHGHLITAQIARELLAADTVLFIPAHLSPHKQSEVPAATGPQRLEMLRRALQHNPHFLADGRELLRPGASYTIDTVQELKRQQPADQFTLLLGADQLPKLHTWHKIDQLLAEIGTALLARPGHDLHTGFAAITQYLGLQITQRLENSLLATPLIDISASTIRQRARSGLPISYLVPEAVATYIRDHHLYCQTR